MGIMREAFGFVREFFGSVEGIVQVVFGVLGNFAFDWCR
jgi:hypothetical protein